MGKPLCSLGSLRFVPSRSATLLVAVVLVAMMDGALAMQEEHLDPLRDLTVSVADDLRRSPPPYVDKKTGHLTFERDYLRRNQKTSEYTRLWYRSTRRSGDFVDLTEFGADRVNCFPGYAEIVCAKDDDGASLKLQAGTRLYASTCNHFSDEEGTSEKDSGSEADGNADSVSAKHPTFRIVTSNVTVTDTEDGCKTIRVESTPISAFGFFGTTTFHFFTNHSDPNGRRRHAIKDEDKTFESALLGSLNQDRNGSSSTERRSLENFDLGIASSLGTFNCGIDALEIDLCQYLPTSCPFDIPLPSLDVLQGALDAIEDVVCGKYNPVCRRSDRTVRSSPTRRLSKTIDICSIFGIPPNCAFTTPAFDPCNTIFSKLVTVVTNIENALENLIVAVVDGINTAINALKDAINAAFKEAGLSPIWDGIIAPSFSLSLFNFNYDYGEEKAAEPSLTFIDTDEFGLECLNCFVRVDVGFGFDFQTQELDIFTLDPSFPTSVEYLSLWVSGETELEATFLAYLKEEQTEANSYTLLNGNPPLYTESDPFYKDKTYYPRDYGVVGPRFEIVIGGLIIPIEFFMSMFLATGLRADKFKLLAGANAFATAETGIAYVASGLTCREALPDDSRTRCNRIKNVDCAGDKTNKVCPYTYTQFFFDKWGPDIETENLEIDIKLFPLFTISVFDGVLNAQMLIGANLTVEVDFIDVCPSESNPSGRRALSDAEDEKTLAPPPSSVLVSSGFEPEGSHALALSMRSHDSNDLSLNLGFFITLDVQAWFQFEVEIPFAPFPGSLTISLTQGPELNFIALNKRPIGSICVDLSNCGVATAEYPQLGSGLGYCNSDFDTEVFRREALVPIGDTIFETKTSRVCLGSTNDYSKICPDCEATVALLPFCGPDLLVDEHTRLVAATTLPDGVRTEFYAYSPVFEVTVTGGSAPTVKFSTDLWIPENHPGITKEQCEEGEIKLLRLTGDQWEEQPAELDCSSWARRYAETVTLTIEGSKVPDGSKWLIVGTGLTRWGHGQCASRHNPCDDDAECKLSSEEFTCECNPGFTGDGFYCFDINECETKTAEDEDTCAGDSACVNTVGSFECICNNGFNNEKAQDVWTVQGNDAFAVEWRSGGNIYFKVSNPDPTEDQIEMTSEVAGIIVVERVYWTRPGRKVSISVSLTSQGFLVRTSGKQVPWIYPSTVPSPGGTVLTVRTVMGVADVLSESGSTTSGCDNVDECVDETHNCEADPGRAAMCSNSPGSFICTCPVGYTSADNQEPDSPYGDGSRCYDADECWPGYEDTNTWNNCSIIATCANTEGSFTCACPRGYTSADNKDPDSLSGDGSMCYDVDECKFATHNCEARTGKEAFCINTDGSFACACPRGYTPADSFEPTPKDDGKPNLPFGDGSLCYDENECWFETDNCNTIAKCDNTFGSFTCTCPRGYTSADNFDPGSPYGDGSDCFNANECLFGTHNCDPVATCADTDGSFTCTCPTGYTSSHNYAPGSPFGDGSNCYDSNECFFEENNCDANAVCTNMVGSFACACGYGFYGTGTTGACSTCVDDPSVCIALAECTSPGGDAPAVCGCEPRYVGDGTAVGVPGPAWAPGHAGSGCNGGISGPTQASVDFFYSVSKVELCKGVQWLREKKSALLETYIANSADAFLRPFTSSGVHGSTEVVVVRSMELNVGGEECSGKLLSDSITLAAGKDTSIISRPIVLAMQDRFDTWKTSEGEYDTPRVDPEETVSKAALELRLHLDPQIDGRDFDENDAFFAQFDSDANGALDWREFQDMSIFAVKNDYDSTSQMPSEFSNAMLHGSLTVIFENTSPYVNDLTLDAIVKDLASHPNVMKAQPDASSLNRACDAEQYDKCHRHATCRAGTCLCPVGSWVFGYGQDKHYCKLSGGWAVRFQTPLPTVEVSVRAVQLNCRNASSMPRWRGSHRQQDEPSCANEVIAEWETLVPTLLPLFGETPEWFWSSMHHRVITDESGAKLLQVSGIFQHSDEAYASAKYLQKLLGEGVVIGLNITLSNKTVNGGDPEVFKWRLSRPSNEQPFDNVKYIGECDPERPEPLGRTTSASNFIDAESPSSASDSTEIEHPASSISSPPENLASNNAISKDGDTAVTSSGNDVDDKIEALIDRTNSLMIVIIASIGVATVALFFVMYLAYHRTRSQLPLGGGAEVRAGDVEASKMFPAAIVYANYDETARPASHLAELPHASTAGVVLPGATVVCVEPLF